MFRCIHANSANLFHGGSPLFEICNDLIVAQSMPSGAVHPNTQTSPSRWSGHVAFSPFAGDLKRAHPGARRPSRCEVPAVKSPHSISVPKTMLATYDAVAALTDTFCCDKLNDEYRDLARAMTAALCRKRPSPLASGQRRTWACSIIYALGQINFLSDKATQPYMAMADVCAAFSVGQSTASAKARVISDALHAHRMDPAGMLPSLVDQNPLVWMAEVNGVLVDLRDMPRELQVIAYEKGMIPYVPADKE
jgi:hypothetical protein